MPSQRIEAQMRACAIEQNKTTIRFLVKFCVRYRMNRLDQPYGFYNIFVGNPENQVKMTSKSKTGHFTS